MPKRTFTIAPTDVTEKALLAAIEATRGVPSNVRPAGVMADRRTKRRRTRAAVSRAAIEES